MKPCNQFFKHINPKYAFVYICQSGEGNGKDGYLCGFHVTTRLVKGVFGIGCILSRIIRPKL